MRVPAFSEGDTSATFRALVERTVKEIFALDNDYVLRTSAAELEAHFLAKATIELPELVAEDRYIQSQQGVKIDVSNDIRRGGSFDGRPVFVKGTKLRVAVPYRGDPALLRLRPSMFSLNVPVIDLEEGFVVLEFQFIDDDPQPDQLKGRIEAEIRSLSQNIANIRSDVAGHNEQVARHIQDALRHKRESAEKSVGAVASLGIPLMLKDKPDTYVLPTKRRPAPVKLPSAATGAYEPEPALAQQEYEHILSILKSMALAMERGGATFSALGEEAIRDFFLVHLNGHYDGSAAGETFNAQGKTDILIRHGNRNAFIAECKIWRGPIEFNKAIDQLLSYLSWRDSKSALLIFNRNRDSTAVQAKMHESMKERPECKKVVRHGEDARYIFVKESDPGREIQITTLLFDVPDPASV